MFEANNTVIPIYVDFEKLIRYHFGVFAFTGGGKSNLTSNVLRRILLHTDRENTKTVLFDISCEYPFLLLDVLADPAFPSRIVLEHRVNSVDQLFNSIVKPREYEEDERIKTGLERIMEQKKVAYYTKPKQRVPKYIQFLEELSTQRKDNIGKPHYMNAIERFTMPCWSIWRRMD